jgi:hypothetical protein
MRRRRFWLWILAIVLVPPYVFPSRIPKVENVDKIQVGMTQSEVEALLGGPPGIHGLHGDAVPTFTQISGSPAICRYWTGDNRCIGVWFVDNSVCKPPGVSPIPAPLEDTILYWSLYPLRFWLWDLWTKCPLCALVLADARSIRTTAAAPRVPFLS